MKTWCKHIKWDSCYYCYYLIVTNKLQAFTYALDVPEKWTICPICATPRPKVRKKK